MGDANQPGTVDGSGATRAPGDPPVALDDYASMCAEIDAGVALPKVLEHRGVTAEAWSASQAHWLRRMNDEAERKKLRVTTRYQATFKAKRAVFEAKLRRERAREERAPIAPLDTAAMVAADKALSAPMISSLPNVALPDAPPPAPRRGGAMPIAMPSGLPLGVPTGSPVGGTIPSAEQRARELTGSSASPAFAPSYASPSRGAAPAPPPRMEPAPPSAVPMSAVPISAVPISAVPMSAIPISEAPATAPAGAPRGGSLPFQPPFQPPLQPSAQPMPAPPAPKITKKPDWSRMTADIGPAIRQAVAAIPFQPRAGAPSAASSSPAPVAAPPSASPGAPPLGSASSESAAPTAPRGPSPGAKPKHLYATMGVDYGALAREALPFHDKGSEGAQDRALAKAAVPPLAPPPPKGPESSAPSTQKTPSEPPRRVESELGRTGTIDPEIIKNALAGGIPFAKRAEVKPAGGPADPPPPPGPSPAPTKGTRFPINVFASLTAEIAEQPANAAAIRARYGLTEEVHREESAHWTAAFERDPALRDRYFGIVKRYRAYLQSNKK